MPPEVATGPVAFLFLGEMLLFPHLYPIVEAISATSEVDVDLWVSTSAHEALLSGWAAELRNPNVRVRRAPGFRKLEAFKAGENPPLPPKMPMLARLLPHLRRAGVVVCAEQTSLWLPTLFPLSTPFVKTSHGVGSMSARDDRRRRAAALTLVPSERERRTYLERGLDPARVVATGYVKASFQQRSGLHLPFADPRPIILYAPHWQEHRSSWWAWGPEIVRRIIADGRYNVIFAPHQRLAERAPQVRDFARSMIHHPNIHCDLDSFAMVDGSYTAAANIYLGDTSSQVVEFLMRPRPCLFLNPQRADWAGNPFYAQWKCGEVVADREQLLAALDRASPSHPKYAAFQIEFAASSLGDTSGAAPLRAAGLILALLEAAPFRKRGR